MASTKEWDDMQRLMNAIAWSRDFADLSHELAKSGELPAITEEDGDEWE